MDHSELVRAIRGRTDRHISCCQSVLLTFCAETGLSEETALALGSPFGSGMHMGAVCGALTGGLMVLGLLGSDRQACAALTARFRSRNNNYVNCRDLLRAARDRGEERSSHCDRMVFEVVADLDELLQREEP